MIASLKRAVLHILDAESGVSVYSDAEIDLTDAACNNFISRHIEKVYDSSSLRKGEFDAGSGFKYQLTEYLKDEDYFVKLSQFAARRLYEGISQSEKPEFADVIICDCTINERDILAILKLDTRTQFTHRVDQSDGSVNASIISHRAILPSLTQKIGECAFIDKGDFTIKYRGRKCKIDGETVDLIADILLECVYDISPRESVNAVKKIAKKVTADNGGDQLETLSKMKEYVTESVEEGENDFIETSSVAEKIFDGRPAMREEFMEKIEKEKVPERVEVSTYVTKKLTSNVKIVTDTGIELIFPAEYYQNSDYVKFINNDDGTISIQINNIGELINK